MTWTFRIKENNTGQFAFTLYDKFGEEICTSDYKYPSKRYIKDKIELMKSNIIKAVVI